MKYTVFMKYAHLIWKTIKNVDPDEIKKNVTNIGNKIKDIIEEASDFYTTLRGEVASWWNRKQVALVGPTASGKTSFWCRLSRQEIPSQHNNTRGVEIKKIEVKERFRSSGDQEVEVRFYARGVDVGGETNERERYWKKACNDADIIFFLVNTKDVLEGRFKNGDPVYDDMKWLSSNISSLNKSAVVHVLFNFIDVAFEDILTEADAFQRIQQKLEKPVESFMDVFRKIMYPHEHRLISASPISMLDTHLYRQGLLIALNEIHKAQTTEQKRNAS